MGQWGEKQEKAHGVQVNVKLKYLACRGTNSVASTVVGADFAPLRHHRQYKVVE